MKKKITPVVWGIVLIVAGVMYGGDALGLWDFSLFFDGWWTLFLIVPSLVAIFTDGPRTDKFIVLLLGVGMLLAEQDVVAWKTMWKLALPVLLVIIGVKLLFGRKKTPVSDEAPVVVHIGGDAAENTASVFSGDKVNYAGCNYTGSTHTAIFGGFDVDLRDAVITQDVVINATCIFGGGDIYLPPNVKLKMTGGLNLFGGSADKRTTRCEGDAPTVWLKAVCIFGGVDVK